MFVYNLKYFIFIILSFLSVDYLVGNKCLVKYESYKKFCYESVIILKLIVCFIFVIYLRY